MMEIDTAYDQCIMVQQDGGTSFSLHGNTTEKCSGSILRVGPGSMVKYGFPLVL